MSELTITLSTLTPLWTGGVDGTMDRVHETGIIGSLRWWYEAIVRGLGGKACDPSEHTCELTGERLKRYEAARRAGKDWWEALDKAKICDACKVFGTTGWKRQFRLEVIPEKGEIDLTEGMFPSSRVHSRGSGYRVGGWMLRGGYFGTLTLQFLGDEEVLCCEVLPTLRFIEQWGALGPKTALGYGVFKIEEVRLNRNSIDEGCGDCANSRVGQWWWHRQIPGSIARYSGISPALSNMFFAKVRFQPNEDNWWQGFKEVEWLKNESIPEDEAIWTGKGDQPSGPYQITNAFPYSRLEHWHECHKVFPLAPVVRNRLRYGRGGESICNGNGESNWCKFVFGTTQGREPVCGYCGSRVIRDQNNPQHYRCIKENVSLTKEQIIQDSKRIQSKIRVSWAYRLPDSDEWELRIWGWLPEDATSNGHSNDQRTRLLSDLQSRLGVSGNNLYCWHVPENDTLWPGLNLTSTKVCWSMRGPNGESANYLNVLQNECNECEDAYENVEATSQDLPTGGTNEE